MIAVILVFPECWYDFHAHILAQCVPRRAKMHELSGCRTDYPAAEAERASPWPVEQQYTVADSIKALSAADNVHSHRSSRGRCSESALLSDLLAQAVLLLVEISASRPSSVDGMPKWSKNVQQ